MSARRVTGFELWRASWPLGWRWVMRGIEYTRCLEYPLVLADLSIRANSLLLDVGVAPYSLITLYIARTLPCRLVAIDISSYIARFAAHADELRPRARVFASAQDARQLGLGSRSFDAAIAVSSIEHIPANGDSQAMREIARVLRIGGQAIVSVPYAVRARDEYVDEALTWPVEADAKRVELFRRPTGRRVFFQRRYDDAAIRDRLVTPSGLHLLKTVFFGEPGMKALPALRRRTVLAKALTNWANPFLAALFLSRLPDELRHLAEGVVLVLSKDAASLQSDS